MQKQPRLLIRNLSPVILFLLCISSNAQKELKAFSDQNKKWGYKDAAGRIIVSGKYDYAGYFFEGRAAVALNKKWGVIDVNGQEIIGLKYDSVGKSIMPGYREDLAAAKLNGKWGFIDKQGKEIIPIKYQDVGNFQYGMAAVKQNNKWGFIDNTGKEIIPPKYQEVWPFQKDVSIVQLNKKWGVIDKTGKEVITLQYDELDFVTQIGMRLNWLKAKLNGKWGFMYFDGDVIIPFKYEALKEYIMTFDDDTTIFDKVGDFINDVEMVSLNGKWGAIDLEGREAIPIKYQDIQNEGDVGLLLKGWFRVKLNNKWGLVDTLGRELIAPQYANANFKYDSNAVNKIAAAYKQTALKSGPDAGPQTNQTKVVSPPLTMKGIIDPAIVGTWKYHNDAMNFNAFYIFRNDGTYDYYSDMITPTPPPPSYKNFWRANGEDMEFIVSGKNEVIRQRVLRRNDPQTNRPALLIPWNSAEDYRTYFPTEAHNLWPSGTSSQKTNETNRNAVPATKLVEPPMRLNGNVDLSIVGLWKGTLNKIDYYLDIKPDGTYTTYSSSNSKPSKCYWRINGDHIETFCEGMKQVTRFAFKKVNDLKTGKPTITFDGFSYFSETEREMWK